MKTKLSVKKIVWVSILTLILAGGMIFSSISYKKTVLGKRRVFIFPSSEGDAVYIENRYLQSVPEKTDIQIYVDDILLGSGLERTKQLFTLGTRAKSCFLRDSVLYVDFTDDIIKSGTNVVPIKTGMELLTRNIKLNFPEVTSVEYFVNGKYASNYSEKIEETE